MYFSVLIISFPFKFAFATKRKNKKKRKLSTNVFYNNKFFDGTVLKPTKRHIDAQLV
jgi:hypothetical protein